MSKKNIFTKTAIRRTLSSLKFDPKEMGVVMEMDRTYWKLKAWEILSRPLDEKDLKTVIQLLTLYLIHKRGE